MLSNYLKIAFRNLYKNKYFSIINIFGLSIGLACFILIALFIQNETLYDSNHENRDNICRIVLERRSPGGPLYGTASPPLLAGALAKECPQVKNAVRLINIDNPVPLISSGDKKFYESKFFFADADIFQVFTIPVIAGNSGAALNKPNSIAIMERVAEKYFGENDPVGETIAFNNYLQFEITSVVKNPPANSTFQFDFLASFSSLESWLGNEALNDWQNYFCQTYILLPEKYDRKDISKTLSGIISRRVPKENSLQGIHLQPLNRIHLYSFEDFGLISGGHIKYLYLFGGIGFFILAIAGINFVNMTAARSLRRAGEVGVRKVFGATKSQIARQFLTEIFLHTSISLIIGYALTELALPNFKNIIGRDIASSNHISIFLAPVALTFILSMIGNSYPAFFMSALKPVSILKGASSGIKSKLGFRKALIVFQFALTLILTVNTWFAFSQLKFMQSKSLGAGDEKIVIVPIRNEELRENTATLKSRLKNLSGVIDAGAAALYPGGPIGKTRYKIEGNSEEGSIPLLWTDHDFIKTLKLQLIAGRDFSETHPSDISDGVIINEEAAAKLGWKDPSGIIGKSFELVGSKKGTIIGVVRNFYFTSLQHKIEPVALTMWPWSNYMLIRVNGAGRSGILNGLEKIWAEYDPENPFTYSFLEDDFNKFYKSESLYIGLSGLFALLGIIIACIGLFSLSAFIAEQSAKEYGIRKVLGASVISIISVQMKKYSALILIANAVSIPLSYWIISEWLDNFAYKIKIDSSVFLISGAAIAAIAFAAAGYHIIRVSFKNPIESLRHE